MTRDLYIDEANPPKSGEWSPQWGILVERFRDNPMRSLARYLGRARVVIPDDFDALYEAYCRGVISEDEWVDVNQVDVMVWGQQRDKSEVHFVVQIGVIVDESDVIRARRRSDILRRVGFATQPAVDGQRILDSARTLAADLGVTVLVREPADAA